MNPASYAMQPMVKRFTDADIVKTLMGLLRGMVTNLLSFDVMTICFLPWCTERNPAFSKMRTIQDDLLQEISSCKFSRDNEGSGYGIER